MKILFLAHLFPLPLDSGGKIKSYHTARALAQAHDLCVLAYVRTDAETKLLSELREQFGEVRVVSLKRGRLGVFSGALSSLALGRSFVVSRDFRKEMLQVFRGAVRDFQPDVVHIDHLQMAQFVQSDGSFGTVLDHHNVESTIVRRLAETSDSVLMRFYGRLEWPKLRAYELEACRRCDLVVTVSEQDRSALEQMEPALSNVRSLPIGVDTDYFRSLPRSGQSRNLLSIGTMYWPPNVESILYFHREVLPLVRKQEPDCRLTIAGQRPARSIMALAEDPAVRVTGYVDDIRELAAGCGVFVVPLRSGSGVRVKILNALAMGLPVVSTTVGAEGLEVVSGEHLLIADTPEEFAGAVVEVLRRPDVAARLGENGRKLVCEKYSWGIIGRRWLELYEEHFARRKN